MNKNKDIMDNQSTKSTPIQNTTDINNNNIDELKKQCEEYLNNWHTEKANFLNYQQNEQERFEHFANLQKMSFIEDLLNIMDSFELSLNALGDNDNDPKWKQMKEGFYLIYSQLDNFLKKQGVVKIEALNQQFNPKMHEAIEVQTDPNKEDGLIIEEFQKGYLYKDMVLRPSKVKVINNK